MGVIALAVVVSRAPNTPATGVPSFVRPAPANQLTQVKVVQPSATTHQVSVNANGSISVRNYIDLTPQVSGRIETIAAALRVGGTFAAGETLLVLDQSDFKLRLAQAQADVASLAQSLYSAKSDAAKRTTRCLIQVRQYLHWLLTRKSPSRGPTCSRSRPG